MAKKLKAEPKRVDIDVHLPLSAAEQKNRIDRALNLLNDAERLELEKKEVANKYAVRIKGMKVMSKRLMEEYQTGTELKTISAIEKRNFATNRVEYVFKGKVVKSRELTFADRQEELPIKTAKSKLTKAEAEAKACAATPGKKLPRGQKQPIDTDIADAIKQQTNRKTAHTATDGVVGNVVGNA